MLECGLAEALLEQLQVAHLAVGVVRRAAWLVRGREQFVCEHGSELVDEERLGAVDVDEAREHLV